MHQTSLLVERAQPLCGQVSVPGDKSISHRAVILGSLAYGKTTIDNFLPSTDCLNTVNCLRKLGASIEVVGNTVIIHGHGPEGLTEPTDVLDVGNSGTTIRLLTGLAAGLGHYAVLTGDASIRRRPMQRIVEPLRRMGAVVMGRKGGKLAPLTIWPGYRLQGIHYETPMASAQVKSCILLAGLFADGQTTVLEPYKSRDHTERMLRRFGVTVEENGNMVSVSGRSVLKGTQITVPGDFSSAAFLLAAAALIPDSKVTVLDVGLNPTRTGFLDVLIQMGARIEVEVITRGAADAEPVGNVTVESAPLSAVEIDGQMIPRLIDEIPILAVLAACARGRTKIRNATELRFKESDRIAAICRGLAAFGVEVDVHPDGMEIVGAEKLLCPTTLEGCGDHRIIMSLSVLAARAVFSGKGPIAIRDASAVDVSFPGYLDVMHSLGLAMRFVKM